MGILFNYSNKKITFINLMEYYMYAIDLNDKTELSAFFAIIDKIQSGNYDSVFSNEFEELLDRLTKSDIQYLESVYKKKFDKKTILNGFYDYLNDIEKNKSNISEADEFGSSWKDEKIDTDEFDSIFYDEKKDSNGLSVDSPKLERDEWGKKDRHKNKRHRTRGGRSKLFVDKHLLKKNNHEFSYDGGYSGVISLQTLFYGGGFSGSDNINKMFQLLDELEKDPTNMWLAEDFHRVIELLDYSDVYQLEDYYKAKLDRDLLIKECYELSNKNLQINGKVQSSINNREMYIGYPSVIQFIELKTGLSILNLYNECLDKLYKESDNVEVYVEKSNLLIDEILSSLKFDKNEMIKLIQEHFSLIFNPNKSSNEIIDELIGDELRYYQQLKLSKDIDVPNLGNSKLIQKGIVEDENGKLPVTYTEIRSDKESSYMFNMGLFDKCVFSIHSCDGEELSKETVENMVKNKLFAGDLSNLEIYPAYNGSYNIYNNDGNNLKFTM